MKLLDLLATKLSNQVDVSGALTRDKYYSSMFGDAEYVNHELLSLVPHIDIYSFPPDDHHKYRLLVSSGMSDVDMFVPTELGKYSRAELVLPVLESTYQSNQKAILDCVRGYARYVHGEKTYFYHGHTSGSLHNGYSILSEQGGNFNNVMFVIADEIEGLNPVAFNKLFIDGHKVMFLQMIPLTDRELAFKLESGATQLLEKGMPNVFDNLRQSII